MLGLFGTERSLRRFRRKGRRLMRKATKRRFYPIYAGLILVFLWAFVFPKSFSDTIWTFFWGPVVADIAGHPIDGIREGYNPINTLAYALVLVALLYYGYPYLRRFRIWFGPHLMLSLFPVIVSAALARVLEDAGAFPDSVAWVFVSPFIYLFFGFMAVFNLFFSRFLETRERFEYVVLCIIPYPIMMKSLWYVMGDAMSGSDILFFMVLSAIFMAFHMVQVRRKGYEMASSMMLYSMYVLSIFIYYSFSRLSAPGNPEVLPAVLLIAGASTALTAVIGKRRFRIFSDRVNLAIVFSFSMDGAATWIGTSYFGYGEKHVLSGMLVGYAGGPAFFISKVALSLMLVYILDGYLSRRGRWNADGNMINLVKFVLIFLSAGPGIRDMLRIAMGV